MADDHAVRDEKGDVLAVGQAAGLVDQGVVGAELVLAHRLHLHRTGVDGFYIVLRVPHLDASQGPRPRHRVVVMR